MARLTFSGFNALAVMDPEACRPFDRGRAGMNIGEGAAMLVLEDFDRRARRGATIYAEVAGHSLTCEAFHPTSPEPDGRAIADAIRRALDDAAGRRRRRRSRQRARHRDAAQRPRRGARASGSVFGERRRRLPVTSIKSMIGHCLGAAGGDRGRDRRADRRARRHSADHPSQRHRSGMRRRRRRQRGARSARCRCAVSTSLAFGGNDSALVLRAV